MQFEGQLAAIPGRYAIVVSRYNESITGKLLAGALQTLAEHGVSDEAIDIAWVPALGNCPWSQLAGWIAGVTWR